MRQLDKVFFLLFLFLVFDSKAQTTFRHPVDKSHLHTNCGLGGTCASNSHLRNMHNGVDYLSSGNGNIYAANHAKVIKVKWNGGNDGKMGTTIILEHSMSDKNGTKKLTQYSHLSNVYVHEGQFVNKGDIIGYQGKTDTSVTHLHFETKKSFDYGETLDNNISGEFGRALGNTQGGDEVCKGLANNAGTWYGYCTGYSKANSNMSDLGFYDPEKFVNNSGFKAYHPIELKTDLGKIRLVHGESVSETLKFKKDFIGSWTGIIYLELLNKDGTWRGDIDKKKVDWSSGLSSVEMSKSNLISSPGNYKLQVTYSNGTKSVSHSERKLVGNSYESNADRVTIESSCKNDGYIIYEDFDDGKIPNGWTTFSGGDWGGSSWSNYIRQYDQKDSYVRLRMGYFDVSTYSSYEVNAYFELEQDHKKGSDIKFDIIDGYIRLYYDTKNVRINYGGVNDWFLYDNLDEDEKHRLKIQAYQDRVYVYIDGSEIGSVFRDNDWDNDDFTMKTYYADVKLYEYSVNTYCSSNSRFSYEDISEDDNLNLSEFQSLEVEVYPNPSLDGNISFYFNNYEKELIELQIYDLQGKIIYQEKFTPNQAEKTINLETKKGLYVYRVIGVDSQKTGKIIIR